MITYFLATVIGWYFVIVSLFLLFRNDLARASFQEIIAHRGLMLILAIITLILGLIMIVSHNIWVIGWPVLVTLIGWFVLISAFLRLFFPEIAIHMGQMLFNHSKNLTIAAIVFLVIGLFLLFMVYVAG